MAYRVEEDALGKVNVPEDAYYGVETTRALDLFKISGIPVQKEFIMSYVMIKRSAAIANNKARKLDSKISGAIVKACDLILKGKFGDQFKVDAFQAGAGTSTNMNVNEVIANVAIELLGGKKGNYKIVHPNDHVNMSQSTNDTYPSNINVASYLTARKLLLPQLKLLQDSLYKKSREFSKVIKIGRTHLQDAVPMTLGEEFLGYAGEVERVTRLLNNAMKELLELSLGGTAVGTGINGGKEYEKHVITELNKITGEKFFITKNKFMVTQSRIEVMALNDALTEVAVVLMKIANDFRLLTSGPRAGIHELLLPEVVPGSSIMPGKVNPSMAEMLNMVCIEVIGVNRATTEATNGGQLELNVFTPLMAHNLLFSINLLTNGINAFRERCVDGVKADTGRISRYLEGDLSLATALNQYIGYSKAAEVARKAYKENKTIRQVCIEMKILDKKKLDEILNPKREAGRE